MNSRGLLALFVFTHLGFIILQIHKHSQIVKLSYAKQKLELEFDSLNKKRERLVLQLHALKNPDAIRQFAQKNLGLEEVTLRQIKKLT